MLARVQSYLLHGIDALACEIEVDLNEGGGFGSEQRAAVVVGLPDAAVKESIERVKSAMENSGFQFPSGRLVVNLAPADVRKEGPLYDLPIAVGVLMSCGVVRPPAGAGGKTARAFSGATAGQVAKWSPGVQRPGAAAAPAGADSGGEEPREEFDLRRYLFAGELALDGRVRPVRGVIAMAALAASRGFRGVIVPAENAPEASLVPGVEAIGVHTLAEVVGILAGHIAPQPHPPTDIASLLATAQTPVDFADVRGQEAVKRAIVVAAAGSHNILRLWAGVRRGRRSRGLPSWTGGHNAFRLFPSGRHGGGGYRDRSSFAGSLRPSSRLNTAEPTGRPQPDVRHRASVILVRLLSRGWPGGLHSRSPHRFASLDVLPSDNGKSAELEAQPLGRTGESPLPTNLVAYLPAISTRCPLWQRQPRSNC